MCFKFLCELADNEAPEVGAKTWFWENTFEEVPILLDYRDARLRERLCALYEEVDEFHFCTSPTSAAPCFLSRHL